MGKIKQWLALRLHPEFEPTEEQKAFYAETIKQQIQKDFYAELDVQSLFSSDEDTGLAKLLPIIHIIVSVVILITVIMK